MKKQTLLVALLCLHFSAFSAVISNQDVAELNEDTYTVDGEELDVMYASAGIFLKLLTGFGSKSKDVAASAKKYQKIKSDQQKLEAMVKKNKTKKNELALSNATKAKQQQAALVRKECLRLKVMGEKINSQFKSQALKGVPFTAADFSKLTSLRSAMSALSAGFKSVNVTLPSLPQQTRI